MKTCEFCEEERPDVREYTIERGFARGPVDLCRPCHFMLTAGKPKGLGSSMKPCDHCGRTYGHDQDCSNAAWFETREYLEGDRAEGRVTVSRRAITDMLDGIYGEDRG